MIIENYDSKALEPGSMASGYIPRDRAVVAVIDGQGGGLGAAIVKEIRDNFGDALEIWALGANSSATGAMMKAKANRGATGENAVRVALPKAKALVGPISITWANAMMGEITPGLAEAVIRAPIHKILIPIFQENIAIAGYKSETLPNLISDVVRRLALAACFS